MRRNILIAFAALMLVALVGLYASKNFEYYDEFVQLGWSDEARAKQFLALSQLLDKNDIAIQLSSRFDRSAELSDVSVLLLPDASYIPHESQKQRIIEWVESGGHLIVGANFINEDDFLSELGFSSEYVSENATSEAEEDDELSLSEMLREQNEVLREALEGNSEEDTDSSEKEICLAPPRECDALVQPEIDESLLSALQFDDTNTLYFYARNYYSLDHEKLREDTEAYWSGGAKRITFAQVPLSDGYVSVITDFSIFENARLAHFDHAYILFKLVENETKVLLVYGWDAPTLLDLLQRHYSITLIAFCILLVFALYHSSRRFGPVYAVTTEARRAQTERMQAQSQFYWQTQNEARLIGELRTEIYERLSTLSPEFSSPGPADAGLATAEQTEWLAERAGEQVDLVHEALNAKLNFQEEQFTQIVSTLQRVRKKI